jgi:predicted phosphate transport protein (TIGR00153 family)
MRAFGKGNPFFDVLTAQARVAIQGAHSFHRMVRNIEHFEKYAEELRNFEHEGDALTRQMAVLTDETFVTPLDKHDLRSLSQALDDIIDGIEATGARFVIYKIRYPRVDVESLVALVVKITEAVQDVVASLPKLRDRSMMQPLFRRVHELENQADVEYREALCTVVNGDLDLLSIIKWKDLYERIERSINLCESTASLVEALVIKYT